MEKALPDIKKGVLSLRQAKEKYSIPKTTLLRHSKQVTPKPGRACYLDAASETVIMKFIRYLITSGFLLGFNLLIDQIGEYLIKHGIRTNFRDNRKWIISFNHRHEELICVKSVKTW